MLPVELPGKALPAGTYVFKLLDTAGARDIVQVFDKERNNFSLRFWRFQTYRDPLRTAVHAFTGTAARTSRNHLKRYFRWIACQSPK